MLKTLIPVFLIAFTFSFSAVEAQTLDSDNYENSDQQEKVSPGLTFLKSFVVPGWGELSLGGESAYQGWWHLGADAVMLTGLFGLNMYVDHTRENMFTHAKMHSGVDIESRGRAYQLAVGRYESIYKYNDTMERQRRWTDLYPETSDYIWEWDDDENRVQYQSMKNDADVASNQIPAVITLMVINRLWSGLNAFLDARDYNANLPNMSVSQVYTGPQTGLQGWQVNLSFSF